MDFSDLHFNRKYQNLCSKDRCFFYQAVHSFQLQLLWSEISRAVDFNDICDQKQAASRKVLPQNLDNHLLPSVFFVLRNPVRNPAFSSEQRVQRKLAKLSEPKQISYTHSPRD